MKEFLLKEYNTKVEVDNILATQGVSGGIVSTLALVSEKGKQVGIVEPFYTYHIFQIERLFGTSVPIRYFPLGSAESDFAPNWEVFEKGLKEDPSIGQKKCDILIVCNPSNPSGRVWKKDELQRLVQLTKENDCTLLIDECYSDMVWKPNVHYSPIQDEIHDHVIVVRGFSKVLGCQSWRVGYTISSASTIATLMKVQDPIYICVPWLQHSLGRYFLNDYDDFLAHKEKLSNLLQTNWAELSAALEKSLGWKPLPPSGTMYGMFTHNEESDFIAVAKALEKGVGVCPGSMFFANFPPSTGFVRIHCGVTPEKTKTIIGNLLK